MNIRIEGRQLEIQNFLNNLPAHEIVNQTKYEPNDSREQPFSKANEGIVNVELKQR